MLLGGTGGTAGVALYPVTLGQWQSGVSLGLGSDLGSLSGSTSALGKKSSLIVSSFSSGKLGDTGRRVKLSFFDTNLWTGEQQNHRERESKKHKLNVPEDLWRSQHRCVPLHRKHNLAARSLWCSFTNFTLKT